VPDCTDHVHRKADVKANVAGRLLDRTGDLVEYAHSVTVSVPEKTLEHWASQYVTYRYRSRAGLWWPARGEDVDVRWLPDRPGKIIQLELKTSVVAGRHGHEVHVDLGQLWDYWNRPLGRQPFYVFPDPDWEGSLEAVATANGVRVSELAFSRSGLGWWFADWMVVLTTQDVVRVLRAELMAHGSSARGSRSRLVRYDDAREPSLRRVTWGPRGGGTPVATTTFRDFWDEIDRCGRGSWPQIVRLQAVLVHRHWYSRREVLELLRLASVEDDAGIEPEFVTLEADEDGFRLGLSGGPTVRRARDRHRPRSPGCRIHRCKGHDAVIRPRRACLQIIG
jgi:hypothetical protein